MQPTQGGDLTGRANNLIVFMQIYMKLFKTLSILQDRYSTLDASKTQRSGHNFVNNTCWYSDSEQQLLVCKGTSFLREHQQIYTKFINSILRSTCTSTCSTISLLKISRLLPQQAISSGGLAISFGKYITNTIAIYMYSTYPLIRTYFFRFSLNGFLCKWCLVEFQATEGLKQVLI